jgi:site-specific DNA-methyltransferase (adenine-specific)
LKNDIKNKYVKKKAKGSFYKDVAFRSDKGDWETPYWLFEILNFYFDFDWDVCADHENALCENYFTKEFSCFENDWSCINYMNPPYGRGIDLFVERAYRQYKDLGNVTVALLPARTDTKYFHNFIYDKAEIIFIKGRLKFGGGKSYKEQGVPPANAPFPSMLVGWGVNPVTFDQLKEEINGNRKQIELELE